MNATHEHSASASESIVTIGIDERLPVGSAMVYGLQHILAMFAGIIAVPLIVGTAIGLSQAELTILIQGAMLASGIGTLIQTLGFRRVGSRLPIAMGTAFVFIAPMITVGGTFGLPAIFGAAIVGGIVELLAASVLPKVRHWFSPLVTGTVVSLVGLGLIPVGFGWAAGGSGDLFGKPLSYIIAGLVLAVILLINRLFKGFVQSVSIVVAIAVGYLLAAAFGILDLSHVSEAKWVALPKIFAFGPPKFYLSAILVMLVAQFASMLETIGDVFAVGAVTRREVKEQELQGAVAADGIVDSLAAVVNGLPVTSFTQNIGVIGITGVASRFAVAAGGGILVVMGLFPKLAGVISAMPSPVLGGAGIVMFGAIAVAGIMQIASVPRFGQREVLIVATAMALGLGFGLHPEGALDGLPSGLKVFLESGVAVGGVAVILLERLLPAKG